MTLCPLCGAALDSGASACPYAVPLDQAPGIGDPGLIAKGKMSHDSHEVHIARWRVHHPADRGATPQVMEWARARLAKEGHTVPGGNTC